MQKNPIITNQFYSLKAVVAQYLSRLKLDEPSQTVATDTIELCEIVIGFGLDGQS